MNASNIISAQMGIAETQMGLSDVFVAKVTHYHLWETSVKVSM